VNLGLMSFDDGSTDMPLVRLDRVRGRSPDQVRAIADAVQEALVEALGIPARDRFQIVTQHEPEEIIAPDAGLGFDRVGARNSATPMRPGRIRV
jgi:phenylpyruvate tautomerase PptA (4-oxalocrotonate tautomerase family)